MPKASSMPTKDKKSVKAIKDRLTPSYKYTWANAEQTSLKREDSEGNVVWVPTDPTNRDYAEFLASGAEAAPYVAPAEPAPLTTEEKVSQLLSDYGLTREELRAVIE